MCAAGTKVATYNVDKAVGLSIDIDIKTGKMTGTGGDTTSDGRSDRDPDAETDTDYSTADSKKLLGYFNSIAEMRTAWYKDMARQTIIRFFGGFATRGQDTDWSAPSLPPPPPLYGRGEAPHQCRLEVALCSAILFMLTCVIPTTLNHEGRVAGLVEIETERSWWYETKPLSHRHYSVDPRGALVEGCRSTVPPVAWVSVVAVPPISVLSGFGSKLLTSLKLTAAAQ